MFVQVSPDTITMAGDSVGISNLPGNVTRALAEDVSYRTREVTNLASMFLRHGRKRKLTTNDMNLALKWSDVDQVLGQGGCQEVSVSQLYTTVPELDLFVDTDRDVDVVLSAVGDIKPAVEQETRLSMSASWLHVEGSGESNSLSGPMLAYYNAVVSCTLGDSEHLCAKMMRDVSNNGKISPLLTNLITFIRHIMKRFQSKTMLQTRMLRLISAIFSNPHLNLSPKPYLSHLVTALLETVLCNNLVSVGQVTLASSVLSLALARWATPVNQLKVQTINHLRDTVTLVSNDRNHVQGLKQYGALTCLSLLGPSLLCDSLHPWPPQLWSHMDTISRTRTEVASLQWAAIRTAGARIINHWIVNSEHAQNSNPNWTFYQDLYKYFGESLVPHLKLISKCFDSKAAKKACKIPEIPGRIRLRKRGIISSNKVKPDPRKVGDTGNRPEAKSVLTASQNFEFLADMGVPSDIFDEPVSCIDFSESLTGTRQENVSQHQQVPTFNAISNIKHQNPSRYVREVFPEAGPVRRLRSLVIQLPLMSSVNTPVRSRRETGAVGDVSKYNCVPWRHLVTGGRVGNKLRRADSNKIDKLCSYVDIFASSGM